MFNFVKQAALVLWSAIVQFMDWLTIKESPWQFVGDGYVVDQKSVERGPLEYVAKVFVDWATMGMRHGTFGIDYKHGCIPSENGLYFYPAQDRDVLALELMACHGMTRMHAEESAAAEVQRHHELALSFGRDWWLYGIELTAKSVEDGAVVTLTKSGMSVTLDALNMDPTIVREFDKLSQEAELLLEGTVGQASFTNDYSLV